MHSFPLRILIIAGLAISMATGQERFSARLFMKPSEQLPRIQQRQVLTYSVRTSFLRALGDLPTQQFEIEDFPTALNQTEVVELKRTYAVTDGQTQWWSVIRAPHKGLPAQLEPIRGPVQQSYVGTIVGKPQSHVWLSVVDGLLYGIIEHEDGTIIEIEPTWDRTADGVEHTLRHVTNDTTASLWKCGAAELPDYQEMLNSLAKAPRQQQFSPLLQARVAVESTTSLYQRLGRDKNRVAAYIAALFSMVSRIYEKEINVTLRLSTVMIWSEPPDGEQDPYQNQTNIAALLGEVTRYWNQYWPDVQRDVVHTLTAPSTTDVGGIGRLATLCIRNSAYSVSGIRGNYTYPTTNYTWDVFVVAHEIGHVFGAPHTHDCYWAPPLDTCVTKDGTPPIPDACYQSPLRPRPSWNGGSIMSYCHLVQPTVALTFRERVATVVRNVRAANCLRQPQGPTLRLIDPTGNESFVGGSMVTIEWTSVQVQTVRIEYSPDSLRTWYQIAASIPASQRTFRWEVPRQSYPNVWLRIVDPSNPLVGDTTKARFSIIVPTLVLSYPKGGERIGFNELVTIQWTPILVDTVRVLVSFDGGAHWDTLQARTIAQSYRWTVPPRASDNVILRIESITDPRIVTESAPFAIGAPTLTVIAPNGGEQWIVGTQQTIRWNSDFVSRIRIDYSTDGGNRWQLISISYDATLQSYQWTIPNTPTTQALVRLRRIGDTSTSAQSSAPFAIIANNPQSVDSPLQPSSVKLLSTLVADDRLWLHISGQERMNKVSMRILTLIGQSATDLTEYWLSTGDTVVPFSLPPTLSSGTYLLQVQFDGHLLTIPFVLLR